MEATYQARKDPVWVGKKETFDFPPHFHFFIEIVYVDRGEIIFGVNGIENRLSQGDIFVCGSGDAHYFKSTGAKSSVYIAVVNSQLFTPKAILKQKRRIRSLHLRKDDLVKHNILDINQDFYEAYKHSVSNDLLSDLKLNACAFKICLKLFSALPTKTLTELNDDKYLNKMLIIENALDFIKRKIRDNITIEDVAAWVKVDPFYFSKLFNSTLGVNFKTYINNERVHMAKNMILSSDYKISYIAYECGFNSLRTFNRAYKSVLGYIPSETRKRNHEFYEDD